MVRGCLETRSINPSFSRVTTMLCSLTLRRINRSGFSVQRVRLPLQSYPYKARGASLPERSTHFRAMFRYALPYISNLKKLVLWYLLLEAFTRTSFPVRNPITSVFKVRCLSTTGFLKWLNTLTTTQIIDCISRRLKSRSRFHPSFKRRGLSASRCSVSRY